MSKVPLPRIQSEADLCDHAAQVFMADGWGVFPEVGGFDLLLDGPGGFQIGVEAKLRPSAQVLSQAFRRMESAIRPDRALVLVSKSSPDFRFIAHNLGLWVCDVRGLEADGELWRMCREAPVPKYWEPVAQKKRLEVPPIPLAVGGGRPSPRKLSGWRISALRVCSAVIRDGVVTKSFMSSLKMSPRYWADAGWLAWGAKQATLVAGPRFPEGPMKGYEAERLALEEHDAAVDGARWTP